MSGYGYDIVNSLYDDNKVETLELVSNAMKQLSIEAIQDKRVEVAQSWFLSQEEEE